MRRFPKIFELNAFSITFAYLVFALLWILLSDQFLIWITNDPYLISHYQTLKGILYVLGTAGFLYVLIRTSNKKLGQEKKRIDHALEAAKMATWTLDIKTGETEISQNHQDLFGRDFSQSNWKLEEFYSFIHPEDREQVKKSVQNIINNQHENYRETFRIIWPDGTTRWMHSRGNMVHDAFGKAVYLTGVISDITAQKQLEIEFEKEKKLFESIFQNIPVMINIMPDEHSKRRANKYFKEITGWTTQEMQEQDVLSQLYPDPKEYRRVIEAKEEADGSWHEFECITKSGEKRIQKWANIRLSEHSTVGIGLDITEQKILEEKLEKDRLELQKVYDNIPVFINLHNQNGKVYRVNKYFEEKTGYTNEQLPELNVIEAMFPHPEVQKKAREHMAKATGSWDDFMITTQDGRKLESSWINVQVTEELKLGIGLDTSNLKQKERALEELTRQYRDAEKLADIGHWRRNLRTNHSMVSDGFYELAGVDKSEQEFSFDLLEKIIVPEDWPAFKHALEQAYEIGSMDVYYRIRRHDNGKLVHIHELGKVDFDESGEPKTISGTIQDITETVERQEKIKEVTRRYQKAEQIAGVGHWYRNVQTDDAIWSDGFYEITGIDKDMEDTSFTNLLSLIHPEDREPFKAAFDEALETGKLDFTYRLIRPDNGQTGHYHELAETEYNDEGEPIAVSGTIQDITEQVAYEKQLKQRNEFIETTLENLPIGVAVNRIDKGTTTLINRKFSQIYGWPKDMLTDVETFFEKVYPDEDYREKIKQQVMTDMESGEPERMSWKGLTITTKSGEERIVNAKNIPVYAQNLMISTVVDVTAQTRAEQRLAESEHNYRLLFQQSPLPMFIFNPENLSFVEVNRAAVKHYGYTRQDFSQMTLMDIRPEEDRQKLKEVVASSSEKISDTEEWRHIKKNGEVIYVNITGTEINYFGKSYRLVLVNDITEQKKAEEMVLSSLVEGENKERARIARELHDGLGQYLAAANMNFDAVKEAIDKLMNASNNNLPKA